MEESTSENSILRDHFLEPWREYATFHRPVFLQQVLEFARTLNRAELAELRKALRGAALARIGKRGRPRGSKNLNQSTIREFGVSEKKQEVSDDLSETDGHGHFRDICMVSMDFGHLRPVYLKQIFL